MKRRTLALGLLTGLAGCSILPERPPLKLYTLLANLNTQDCRAPKRRLSSVRINSPMIASPYDSTRCYVLTWKGSAVFGAGAKNSEAEPVILFVRFFKFCAILLKFISVTVTS